MPAALYLSVAIPFLYSSSLNADTNKGSTVGSTGRFGFVGIVPRPLRVVDVRLGCRCPDTQGL